MLSGEIYKVFNNTYFVEYLRGTASNDMTIARFFCKIYCCSLKLKIKGYQKQFLLRNVDLSF